MILTASKVSRRSPTRAITSPVLICELQDAVRYLFIDLQIK